MRIFGYICLTLLLTYLVFMGIVFSMTVNNKLNYLINQVELFREYQEQI